MSRHDLAIVVTLYNRKPLADSAFEVLKHWRLWMNTAGWNWWGSVRGGD
ncbi:MAG: hypothetical protein U1F76_25115 [Candidatus Competibacteraceae bacterium]